MARPAPACPACGARHVCPTRKVWLRVLALVCVRAFRCQACYRRVWRVGPWWR